MATGSRISVSSGACGYRVKKKKKILISAAVALGLGI